VEFASIGVLFLVLGGWILRGTEQRARIALLASVLSRYRIERTMEGLTQGYQRALGEADPHRREQLWQLLRPAEEELCAQFTRFATDFGRTDGAATRVSRLPMWVPFALTLFPAASFDMREALALHARGICRAVHESGAQPARERAFTISAELFLMQHTCHWFCKSRLVASARMLSRHKTSYGQLLDAVRPDTRADYRKVVGR
jgi:hypothetical protein